MTSTPPTRSPRHPIAVVADRTGLSQDILRMWERRYGAVSPTRSAGGQRLYSDDDIERLKLIGAASAAGRRVGSIATLSTEELAQLVEEDLSAGARPAIVEPATVGALVAPIASPESEVAAAFERVRTMDARGLDAALRRIAAVAGVPATLEQVVVPLLRRIGDEWHRGQLSIAAEHLASAVIESFVYNAMREIPVPPEASTVLIATPVGSHHVIAAAMAAALAAAEGWNVLFLGGDVPARDIAGAAAAGGARAVVLSAIYAENGAALVAELRLLRELLPADLPLLAGGAAAVTHADELRRATGLAIAEDLGALREWLRKQAMTRTPAHRNVERAAARLR